MWRTASQPMMRVLTIDSLSHEIHPCLMQALHERRVALQPPAQLPGRGHVLAGQLRRRWVAFLCMMAGASLAACTVLLMGHGRRACGASRPKSVHSTALLLLCNCALPHLCPLTSPPRNHRHQQLLMPSPPSPPPPQPHAPSLLRHRPWVRPSAPPPLWPSSPARPSAGVWCCLCLLWAVLMVVAHGWVGADDRLATHLAHSCTIQPSPRFVLQLPCPHTHASLHCPGMMPSLAAGCLQGEAA